MSKSNKYILLLGGTGAMGKYLVDLLHLHKDVQCYVTSRSKRTDFDNIHYLQGNALNEDFLSATLSMYHWDAIVDFMLHNDFDFARKKDLLLSSTKQYVFVSSARVYADSDEIITEESPRLLDVCTDSEYLQTDEYALSKARQENQLIDSTSSNWTIIRPSKTYGENRIQLGSMEKEDWIYDVIHGRSIVVYRDFLDKYVTFSSGLDVAKCIEVLLCNNDALRNIYNVTGDDYYKWSDILALYVEILQRAFSKSVNVKYFDNWEEWMGGTFYQVKYSTTLNRKISNQKIRELCPSLKLDDSRLGLKTTLEEFIKNPSFNLVSSGKLLQKANKTKEWPSFNEISGKKKKLKLLLMKLNLLHYVRK